MLRQPEAQLHASIAWLLQVRRDFGRPKDELWAEHGERWLTAIAAVTDATAPMRLRYDRLVVTDAAVVAVAQEPNPMAEFRRQVIGALGLPWPVTYSSLGIVHSSLLRYRQPLADPAGLLATVAKAAGAHRDRGKRAAAGARVHFPHPRLRDPGPAAAACQGPAG